MTVHTCTRCPLRFLTRAEMADHLAHDHHMPVEAVQAISYPGAEEAKPLYASFAEDEDVHSILLVSNQSVSAPAVAELLAKRQEEHDRLSVFLVVPATPSTHLAIPLRGRSGPSGELRADDAGLAQARWRLRHALSNLRDAGIVCHGAVGDPNPIKAIADVIRDEPIDEIVLCTLRASSSRWLDIDVPGAIRRQFSEPLTVITTEETGAQHQQVDLTDESRLARADFMERPAPWE